MWQGNRPMWKDTSPQVEGVERMPILMAPHNLLIDGLPSDDTQKRANDPAAGSEKREDRPKR